MSSIQNRIFRWAGGITLLLSLSGCNSSTDDGGTGGGSGVALDCSTVVPGASVADDFVCAHNLHRDSVPAGQPIPDPPLPAMSWNQALADWAQAHVNNCNFTHSDGAARSTEFGEPIGENLYASTGTTVLPESILQNWVSEAAAYDYNSNTCSGTCGHYTQVVWRESVEVGCASAVCATLTGTGWSNALLVSCNYRAAGNYIGQTPY